MSNRIKLAGAATLTAGALLLSGCTSVTEPNQVGLYYNVGDLEGNVFDHCTVPSMTDDFTMNDEIIYLPIDLRNWLIADRDDADSRSGVVVSTTPEANQPSGVQVRVWSNTSFMLNTYCDTNGGTVKVFWENIGRRYKAETEDGWKTMLEKIFVPALEKATQDVVRSYNADQLVGDINGVRAEAQQKIAARFTAELKAATGGDFFCGPTFDRSKPECPQITMILSDVDYADGGIQEARNEKAKQIELAAAALEKARGEAAALMAEATGKKNAAAELAKLYANSNWVKLQETILKTQALIEACKVAKDCKLIVGADGNLIMA